MSVLSCDSDSLAEDWQDLSKSDYAKVIFHNKYYDPESGDVKCQFKLTDSVNKNVSVSDYIGLYKVGYEDLTQCIAHKLMSELHFDEDTKTYECVFKSEDISELNGFFQFLYVTHDKEVFGASMPFAVNNVKNKEGSPINSLTTEKVEDGFLMVRYNLEQKNQLLETIIEKERQEKTALENLCEQLKQEKNCLSHELEIVRGESEKMLYDLANRLDEIKSEVETNKAEKVKLLLEMEDLSKKNSKLSSEMEVTKKEYENVISQFLSAKGETFKINQSKIKLEQNVSSLLIHLNLIGKEENCSSKTSFESEFEAVKAKFDELTVENDISIIERNELKHELTVANEKIVQLTEELKNCKIISARLAAEMKCCAVSPKPACEKEIAYEGNRFGKPTINRPKKTVAAKENIKLKESVESLQKESQNLEEKMKQMKFYLQKRESSGLEEAVAGENFTLKLEESVKGLQTENQKLKDELKQLHFRLQMKLSKENLLASYNKGEMTSDAVFLAEQLDDAKYMIQALEDSKQLVIMEMNDVNKKLLKVTEELGELKCENILWKANLEKATSSKAAHLSESETQLENGHLTNKDVESKTKLENLHIELEKIKLDELKKELALLREACNVRGTYTQADVFKIANLSEKIKCLESNIELEISPVMSEDVESNKELENLRKGSLNKEKFVPMDLIPLLEKTIETTKELAKEYQEKEIKMEEKIKKLREDFHDKNKTIEGSMTRMLKEVRREKDRNIEELKAGMKIMHASKMAMQDTVNEMITRLKDAEQLYKKLYVEKQKLAKKLKKVIRKNNTSSAASSNTSTTDKSESCFLPLNVDVLKASTSTNSDSDTGEHVRAMINPAKVDAVPYSGINVHTDFNKDTVTSAVNDFPMDISNATDVMNLVNEGVSCELCNTILPHAELSEHYNIVHKKTICPICGQLFDLTLPPRFLTIHVNEHFNN